MIWICPYFPTIYCRILFSFLYLLKHHPFEQHGFSIMRSTINDGTYIIFYRSDNLVCYWSPSIITTFYICISKITFDPTVSFALSKSSLSCYQFNACSRQPQLSYLRLKIFLHLFEPFQNLSLCLFKLSKFI